MDRVVKITTIALFVTHIAMTSFASDTLGEKPTSPAITSTNCPCKNVPLLAEIASYSKLNLEFASRFGVDAGDSFALNAREFGALKLAGDSQELLKKNCPEKLENSVVVRKLLGKSVVPPLSSDSVPNDLDSNSPRSIYAQQVIQPYYDCLAAQKSPGGGYGMSIPPACMDAFKKASKAKSYNRFVADNSVDDTVKKIQAGLESGLYGLGLSFGPSYLGPVSEAEQLRVSVISDKMFTYADETKALAMISKETASLSTDAKLLLVQKIGQIFAQNYDFGRTNGGPNAGGVVTLSGLLSAENRNRTNGIGFGITEPDQKFAGVCRDIASGQGLILNAMGFKETYIVAHATTSAWHTTVITQDPNSPKKYYKLNYDALTREQGGEGGTLLYQGKSDVTTEYMIYLPGGRLVKKVPSELGKIMSEASGVSNINPFAKASSSLGAVNIELSKNTSARAFMAKDSLGNDYAGAALTSNLYQSERQKLRFGTVYAHESTRNFDVFYNRLQHVISSPYYNLYKDQIRAKIDATTDAILGFVSPASSGDSKYSWYNRIYGSLDSKIGGEVQIGNPEKDKTVGALRAQVGTMFGGSDVRRAEVSSIRPYINDLILTAEGRYELSKTPEGRSYLIASTAVLLDYFGPKLLAEIGYMNEDTAVKIKAGGRTNSDDPAFTEGSERFGEIAVQHAINGFRYPVNVRAGAGVRESRNEEDGMLFYGNGGFEMKF